MGLAGVGASVSPQLVEASVAKIVAWTSDIRSNEVRKASQDALYALFSLHPAEVTRILNTLPKVCQVYIYSSFNILVGKYFYHLYYFCFCFTYRIAHHKLYSLN